MKGEITTPLGATPRQDQRFEGDQLQPYGRGRRTDDCDALKGNPDEKFTYYYLGYTSKTEYEDSFKGDDQQVIDNALGSIRMGIGNDGSKLPDVASVRMGEGSLRSRVVARYEYHVPGIRHRQQRVGMYGNSPRRLSRPMRWPLPTTVSSKCRCSTSIRS